MKLPARLSAVLSLCCVQQLSCTWSACFWILAWMLGQVACPHGAAAGKIPGGTSWHCSQHFSSGCPSHTLLLACTRLRLWRRKIAEAAAEQPLPGTSQRPYLCGRCKYLRKQARNREPVPLIANPEPVAQLYLKRWAELRKTGVMAGVDNFAQLGAPSHQVQQ